MKYSWIIAALVLLLGGRAFGQCSDYQLSIMGSCPGTVTLFWGGAPPSTIQGFVLANTPGAFTIPSGVCTGTVICIQGSPMLVGTTSTGPLGVGQVSGTAGPAACGKWLIAVANFGSPCKVSNPVMIP